MGSSLVDHDPYDDYDPDQYAYNTEDEYEDDVMYMDVNDTNSQSTSQRNPSLPEWKWTQNPSQHLSQRTIMTPNETEKASLRTNKQPLPSLLPRRERKRRRQQATMEQAVSNDEKNDNRISNRGEDGGDVSRTTPFASNHSKSDIDQQDRIGNLNIFASLLSELQQKDKEKTSYASDDENKHCQQDLDDRNLSSPSGTQQEHLSPLHSTVSATDEAHSTLRPESGVMEDTTVEQTTEHNNIVYNVSSSPQLNDTLRTDPSPPPPEACRQNNDSAKQNNGSNFTQRRISNISGDRGSADSLNTIETSNERLDISNHDDDSTHKDKEVSLKENTADPKYQTSTFQGNSSGWVVDDNYESSIGSRMEYQLKRQQKLRRTNPSQSQSRSSQKLTQQEILIDSAVPDWENQDQGSILERKLAKNRKKVSRLSSATILSSQGKNMNSPKHCKSLPSTKKSRLYSSGIYSPTPITFETPRRRIFKASSSSTSVHVQTKKPRNASSIAPSKSIVGCRPQHWDNSGIRTQNRRSRGSLSEAAAKLPSFGTQISQNKKRSRAAQLAEATKKSATRKHRSSVGISSSFISLPPSVKKVSRVTNLDSSTVVGVPNSQHNDEKESDNCHSRSPQPNCGDNRGSQTQMEHQPKTNSNLITFTPAFLASRKKRNTETIEDTGFTQLSQCATATNTDQGPITPYHPGGGTQGNAASSEESSGETYHKRQTRACDGKKTKAGKLVQKLRSIRGSIEGDLVRFQSGMYPFHTSKRRDTNDPRNRASSYLDITVTGDPVSWECDNQGVTVLGFIHAHITMKVNGTNDQNETNAYTGLAWMCFTYETIRQQKIRLGTDLRIYDAVIMETGGTRGDSCKKIVLCSMLCEPYPAVLPPLPTVPTLMNG